MMNCADVTRLAMAYLDGELVGGEAASVEAHALTCTECNRLLTRERHERNQLRAALKASMAPMPAPARERVLDTLRKEQQRQARRRAFAFSAAAAGVAITAWAAHAQYKMYQRTLYLEDAVSRHVKQFPLEIQQPSPEQLEAWFGGKLDHRVVVPQFPHMTAEGARLLNVRDKQAAYIRYDRSPDDQAGRMGLFVYGDKPGDVDVGAAQEPDIAASNGYNVVSWREGDVVYQLVSDQSARDVQRLIPGAVPQQEAPGGVDRAIGGSPSLDVRPASLQR